MSLEERFNVAADKIKAIPADKMSNEDKLVSYIHILEVLV